MKRKTNSKNSKDAYALNEQYESALLGVTISPNEPTRLVYSLRQLSNIFVMREGLGVDEATEAAADLASKIVAQTGKDAPIFVADVPDKPAIQIDLKA